MVILAVTAIFGALMLLLSFGIRAVEEMEQANRLAEAELEATRMYGAALDERVREVRRYRHDAAGLLRAIEHALGEDAAEGMHAGREPEGATEKQEAHAAAKGGEFPAVRPNASADGAGKRQAPLHSNPTQSELIDAIIAFKQSQCGVNKIAFGASVVPGCVAEALERGVNEADLSALLQNLLENAYEANLQVEDPASRFIEMALVRSKKGKLLVTVSNRVVESGELTFETSKPNPEMHGVGLAIVDQVLARYGGKRSADFDVGRRVLTMKAVL